MGGASECIFAWIATSICTDVKSHKNLAVYAHPRQIIMLLCNLKFCALYYQFPFGVQTHLFVGSSCRHLHFIRNHTTKQMHLNTMSQRIYDIFANVYVLSCCIYSLYRKVAIYNGSGPLGKPHNLRQFVMFGWLGGWVLCG